MVIRISPQAPGTDASAMREANGSRETGPFGRPDVPQAGYPLTRP